MAGADVGQTTTTTTTLQGHILLDITPPLALLDLGCKTGERKGS